MNGQELHSLMERMALELAGQPSTAAPAKAAPAPVVVTAGGCLGDITETGLQRQYLVENPRSGPAFLDLKLRTPTRLGPGRAGARYKTTSILRMRADHAATQDSVFSHVNDTFVEKDSFIPIQTLCQDKDKYLIHPDRGCRPDKANQTIIKKTLSQSPEVVLAVGDGLSSAAIGANVVNCIQTAQARLKTYGLESGPVLFIKYRRVSASDHIGELASAEAVCLLMGEWPGLVTAESMSAYLTYKPHVGIPESERVVISDVHRQGTAAVEASVHIAELIKTMLEKKAGNINLRRNTPARLHGARIARTSVLPCG